MDNKKVLSNNLFKLLPIDMSIKDFAKACDIPYTTMLNYFNLHAEPTATNLLKMAVTLCCPISVLVYGFDIGKAGRQPRGDDK